MSRYISVPIARGDHPRRRAVRLVQVRRAGLPAALARVPRLPDRDDPREARLGAGREGHAASRTSSGSQEFLLDGGRARRHDDHAVHAAVPGGGGRRPRHRARRVPARADRRGLRRALRRVHLRVDPHRHRRRALGGTGADHARRRRRRRRWSRSPGAGAEALFAIGLLGASMLAAAIVPLSTAYGLAEAVGAERSVSRRFREAPLFLGLFAAADRDRRRGRARSR